MNHEDEYGHLVDEQGRLVEDPRCYWCMAEEAAERGVTVIPVGIEEAGADG